MAKDVFSQILHPVLTQPAPANWPGLNQCPRLSAIMCWLKPFTLPPAHAAKASAGLFWSPDLATPARPSAWQHLFQPSSHSAQKKPDITRLINLLCQFIDMLSQMVERVAQRLKKECAECSQWTHASLSAAWLSLYQTEYLLMAETADFIQLWHGIRTEAHTLFENSQA